MRAYRLGQLGRLHASVPPLDTRLMPGAMVLGTVSTTPVRTVPDGTSQTGRRPGSGPDLSDRFTSRRVLLLAFALYCAAAADASQLTVTSTPPEAEVFASPDDEPVMYKKGLTPCTITLDAARGPHLLLLRKAGRFDCYRKVAGGTVGVALASRDDPANWAKLPDGSGLPSPPAFEPKPGQTAPDSWPAECTRHWAPDASGAVRAYSLSPEWLVEQGVAAPAFSGWGAELWWAPLGGEPRLLWQEVKAQGAPGCGGTPEIAFLPDPDWFVVVVAADDGCSLVLRRVSSGNQSVPAREAQHDLDSPAFSPDGRWVAVLRSRPRPHRGYRDPKEPAELLLTRWDGDQRHIVATDATLDVGPAFSPDGRSVAYADTDGYVRVVPAVGGPSRVVIEARGWAATGPPEWSPDGRRLAVTCRDTCGSDGSTGMVSRVIWAAVDGPATGYVPGVWLIGWHDQESLDVQAPSYAEGPAAEYERVVRVGLDGSDMGTLWGPEWLPWAPALSPDGQRIAVLAWRPERPAAVAIVEVASGASRFVEPPAGCVLRRVGWQDEDMVWVEVASGGGGPPGYALDLDGGDATPLDAVPEPTAQERRPPVRVAAESTLSLLVTEDGEERYREVLKLGRPRPTAPTLRCEGEGQ